MKTEDTAPVWLFDFALESESGEPVSSNVPDELMDVIIDWAEKRDLQVGGGFRAPRPEELERGPVYDASATSEVP